MNLSNRFITGKYSTTTTTTLWSRKSTEHQIPTLVEEKLHFVNIYLYFLLLILTFFKKMSTVFITVVQLPGIQIQDTTTC